MKSSKQSIHDFASAQNYIMHNAAPGDSGSMLESNQYAKDFAMFNGLMPQPMYNPGMDIQQRTYQLPHAFVGKSVVIGEFLVGLIVNDKSNFIISDTDGLPVRRTDQMNFQWVKIHFNRSMADLVPHEGVSRIIRNSSSKGSASVQRIGIALYVEHDWMYSPEGTVHFGRCIKQLENSIQLTYNMMVVGAVFACRSTVYDYEIKEKMRFDYSQWEKMILAEAQQFAICQKSEDGLFNIVTTAADVLKSRNFTPSSIWVPSGGKVYFRGTGPNKLLYEKAGPAGPALASVDPQSVNYYQGYKICELEDFNQDEARGLPFNPAKVGRIFGQYFFMSGVNPESIDIESYRTSDRDITITDYVADKFRPITLKMCLDNCHIWTNPEDPAGEYAPGFHLGSGKNFSGLSNNSLTQKLMRKATPIEDPSLPEGVPGDLLGCYEYDSNGDSSLGRKSYGFVNMLGQIHTSYLDPSILLAMAKKIKHVFGYEAACLNKLQAYRYSSNEGSHSNRNWEDSVSSIVSTLFETNGSVKILPTHAGQSVYGTNLNDKINSVMLKNILNGKMTTNDGSQFIPGAHDVYSSGAFTINDPIGIMDSTRYYSRDASDPNSLINTMNNNPATYPAVQSNLFTDMLYMRGLFLTADHLDVTTSGLKTSLGKKMMESTEYFTHDTHLEDHPDSSAMEISSSSSETSEQHPFSHLNTSALTSHIKTLTNSNRAKFDVTSKLYSSYVDIGKEIKSAPDRLSYLKTVNSLHDKHDVMENMFGNIKNNLSTDPASENVKNVISKFHREYAAHDVEPKPMFDVQTPKTMKTKVATAGPMKVSELLSRATEHEILYHGSSEHDKPLKLRGEMGIFTFNEAIEKVKNGAMMVPLTNSFELSHDLNNAIINKENPLDNTDTDNRNKTNRSFVVELKCPKVSTGGPMDGRSREIRSTAGSKSMFNTDVFVKAESDLLNYIADYMPKVLQMMLFSRNNENNSLETLVKDGTLTKFITSGPKFSVKESVDESRLSSISQRGKELASQNKLHSHLQIDASYHNLFENGSDVSSLKESYTKLLNTPNLPENLRVSHILRNLNPLGNFQNLKNFSMIYLPNLFKQTKTHEHFKDIISFDYFVAAYELITATLKECNYSPTWNNITHSFEMRYLCTKIFDATKDDTRLRNWVLIILGDIVLQDVDDGYHFAFRNIENKLSLTDNDLMSRVADFIEADTMNIEHVNAVDALGNTLRSLNVVTKHINDNTLSKFSPSLAYVCKNNNTAMNLDSGMSLDTLKLIETKFKDSILKSDQEFESVKKMAENAVSGNVLYFSDEEMVVLNNLYEELAPYHSVFEAALSFKWNEDHNGEQYELANSADCLQQADNALGGAITQLTNELKKYITDPSHPAPTTQLVRRHEYDGNTYVEIDELNVNIQHRAFAGSNFSKEKLQRIFESTLFYLISNRTTFNMKYVHGTALARNFVIGMCNSLTPYTSDIPIEDHRLLMEVFQIFKLLKPVIPNLELGVVACVVKYLTILNRKTNDNKLIPVTELYTLMTYLKKVSELPENSVFFDFDANAPQLTVRNGGDYTTNSNKLFAAGVFVSNLQYAVNNGEVINNRLYASGVQSTRTTSIFKDAYAISTAWSVLNNRRGQRSAQDLTLYIPPKMFDFYVHKFSEVLKSAFQSEEVASVPNVNDAWKTVQQIETSVSMDSITECIKRDKFGKLVDDLVFDSLYFNLSNSSSILTQALQTNSTVYNDLYSICKYVATSRLKESADYTIEHEIFKTLGSRLKSFLSGEVEGRELLLKANKFNFAGASHLANCLISAMFKNDSFAIKLKAFLKSYVKITSTFKNCVKFYGDGIFNKEGAYDNLGELLRERMETVQLTNVNIINTLSPSTTTPWFSKSPNGYYNYLEHVYSCARSHVSFHLANLIPGRNPDPALDTMTFEILLSNPLTELLPLELHDWIMIEGTNKRRQLVNDIRKSFYENLFKDKMLNLEQISLDDYRFSELEKYLVYAKNIDDDTVRKIYINLLFCKVTKSFLEFLLHNNIPFPFGFLIFRPWVLTEVCDGVLGAFSGGQIGCMVVGKSDTMWEDNAAIKAHYLHYTGYACPLITRAEGLYFFHALWMKRFVSGHNTKFLKLQDIDTFKKSRYRVPDWKSRADYSSRPSLITAITTYKCAESRSVIDLRMKFMDELNKQASLHFTTTKAFVDIFEFKNINENRRPFAPRMGETNMICIQSHQFMYNPSTKKHDMVNISKCHIGKNHYESMVADCFSGVTNINNAILKDCGYELSVNSRSRFINVF